MGRGGEEGVDVDGFVVGFFFACERERERETREVARRVYTPYISIYCSGRLEWAMVWLVLYMYTYNMA